MEKSDFTLLNTEISKLQSEIDKNYTNMKGEVKEGGTVSFFICMCLYARYRQWGASVSSVLCGVQKIA